MTETENMAIVYETYQSRYPDYPADNFVLKKTLALNQQSVYSYQI